ncbi:MAG: DUF5615 family PIN-like protein [Pseudomonadota bacterium]
MQFIADMGISQTTVHWLRSMGYDSVHLRDEGLGKISDRDIVSKAIAEERTILTCDLDFGDILAVSGLTFPSVIIFRLENAMPENINKRLEDILNESSNALEKGAIIIAEESRHRVRFLPI